MRCASTYKTIGYWRVSTINANIARIFIGNTFFYTILEDSIKLLFLFIFTLICCMRFKQMHSFSIALFRSNI